MPDSKKNSMRIARLLAERGICSRRAAEQLIRDGRVKVDNKRITDPALNVNPETTVVHVDDSPLPASQPHMYVALNKPKGFLSSFTRTRDSGRTLESLVQVPRRLFTVGRLDLNSRGLLLITTDGDWANKVMHPRYEKEKEYLVRIRRLQPKVAAYKLSKAVVHEEGREFRCKSAVADGELVRVVLKEGRNRQIRRLAQSAGMEVKDIVRIRIGPVHLGRLKEGTWRNLTPAQVDQLGGKQGNS